MNLVVLDRVKVRISLHPCRENSGMTSTPFGTTTWGSHFGCHSGSADAKAQCSLKPSKTSSGGVLSIAPQEGRGEVALALCSLLSALCSLLSALCSLLSTVPLVGRLVQVVGTTTTPIFGHSYSSYSPFGAYVRMHEPEPEADTTPSSYLFFHSVLFLATRVGGVAARGGPARRRIRCIDAGEGMLCDVFVCCPSRL